MAIDPSIALGFRGPDIGAILENLDRRKQAELQRQKFQMEMDDKRAERNAYGQIFGGGGSVGDIAQGNPAQQAGLTHPSQQAIGALARVNPQAAMQVQKYFDGLGDDERKRETDKWKAAAPLLTRIKQLPYEQRRQFLQSAAPVLTANGWSPQELQSFDPTDQNVDALSSAAMTVGEVTDSMRLRWEPIGENGSFAIDNMGQPTGSGNPFAPHSQVAPSQGGQPSPDAAFGALIQQESGGQAGIRGPKTAYGVPLGKAQTLPATAQEMAGKLGVPWRPDLLEGKSPDAGAYQEKLGRAYFDEGLQKYGGNIEQALKYYHGGPDERLWGPKTTTYAKSVLARVRSKANPSDVRAKAQAAIARGADPEAVRQRAAALGVTL